MYRTSQPPIRKSVRPAAARRSIGRACGPVVEAVEGRTLFVSIPVAAGDTAALIAAINTANSTPAVADTIQLAGGTYTLTAANNNWYGPTGLPAITSDITIEGGATGATIERSAAAATPRFRLFYVAGNSTVSPTLTPGTLTLRGLTVQGGLAQGGAGGNGGGGGAGLGGAIYNQGTLALDRVLLTNNTARGGNSGASFFPAGGGGGLGGAGGTAMGPVTAGGGGGMGGNGGNSQTGSGGGGGLVGNGGSSLTDPDSGGGGGGGATGDGQNSSGSTGGAGGTPAGTGGNGGNVLQAGAAGGTFGGGGGGAIFQDGGAGGFGGGGGGGGGDAVNTGGNGGVGGGGGAGAADARGGNGGFGGGGGASTGDTGGKGGFGGGGGASLDGTAGTGGFGGGAGGTSVRSSGGGGAGLGGAVFNDGGTLNVTNSTFTANTAVGGTGATGGQGLGGAIFTRNGSTNITHATVTANVAANGGRGLYFLGDGTIVSVTVQASILGQTDNAVTDAATSIINGGSSVVINPGGNVNLIRSGGPAIQAGAISADPLLDPVGLVANGGPTRTIGLLPGSPALDVATAPGGLATDQRGAGFARTVGAKADAGAFERDAVASTTTLATTPNPSAPGEAVLLTATVVPAGPPAGGEVLTGGVVQFLLGATVLGSADLVAGQASLNYAGALPSGTSTFTANFGGNGTLNASSDTEVQTVAVAPTADAQTVTVVGGTPTPVTLTGSDTNAPPRSLTYIVTTNPAHGMLSGTAPNLTYTPGGGYLGADSFKFKVNNGVYDSVEATVTLNVTEAPSLVVTTADDVVSTTDGLTSLREAINYANVHAGADTVTFDPAAFPAGSSTTITLELGRLDLSGSTGKTTIQGLGANRITVDADGASRVFNLDHTTGEISGLTITGGNAGAGGGISNYYSTLTLQDAVVAGNAAGTGAGISSVVGTLTLRRTTVDGNTGSQAAGIYVLDGGTTIVDSTISRNASADTGGIRLDVTAANNSLTVINSTISGNTASALTPSDAGVRVSVNNGHTATARFVNATVTDNHLASPTGAGGISTEVGINGGTLDVRLDNTIVAGNTAADVPSDLSGTFAAASSHNVIGAGGGFTNGVNGNQVGVLDPRLAPLGDYGGPTETHLPLADSPATNRGLDALADDENGDPLADDQRGTGFPRKAGSAVDVGAVEAPLPTFNINPQVAQLEGNAGLTVFTFTVSRTDGAGVAAVHYQTVDGSATAAGGDYNAASGDVVFADGQTSKTVTVFARGDTAIEPDEQFFIALSDPFNGTVGAGAATALVLNDDLAPPRISVGDAAVTEGNSGTKTLSFKVTLDRPTDKLVTFKYKTTAGSAAAGTDFTAVALTTGQFLPGQTTATVNVTVKGDLAIEPDETFFLDVSSPTNATVADGRGVGTIVNDDAKPKITVVDPTPVVEGNSGTKTMTFTVKLSNPTAASVTVKYATADGTATMAKNDYKQKSGTLTFAAGEVSKTVTVTVVGDTRKGGDETFFLNLSAPTNATIHDGQGVGTILNDD